MNSYFEKVKKAGNYITYDMLVKHMKKLCSTCPNKDDCSADKCPHRDDLKKEFSKHVAFVNIFKKFHDGCNKIYDESVHQRAVEIWKKTE